MFGKPQRVTMTKHGHSYNFPIGVRAASPRRELSLISSHKARFATTMGMLLLNYVYAWAVYLASPS